MYDNLSNDDIRKIWNVIAYIARFLNKYLALFLFSIYVFWMPQIIMFDPVFDKEFTVIPSLSWLGIGFIFLMYYSLTRLINVYNPNLTSRFLNSEEPIDNFSKKLKFIFTQKENIIELAVTFFLFLILPCKLVAPGLTWLLGNQNGILTKLYLVLIMLPIFFLMYVLANLSAMKYWDKEERKRNESRKFRNKNELKSEGKHEKRQFALNYILSLVAFYLGSFSIMFVIPSLLTIILPFIGLFLKPKFIGLAIFLAVLPFAIYVLRAVIKRYVFISRLKKVCKENKYALSKIQHPYMSLFKYYKGESFNVRIQNRTFSCKLLPGLRKGRPLYILPKGIGVWLIKYKFLRIEIFSYTKSFEFGWESNGKKVLIVNPVPNFVYTPKGDSVVPDETEEFYITKSQKSRGSIHSVKTDEHLFARELDNGDIIDGYEFYAATGFLNALDRDVIDID